MYDFCTLDGWMDGLFVCTELPQLFLWSAGDLQDGKKVAKNRERCQKASRPAHRNWQRCSDQWLRAKCVEKQIQIISPSECRNAEPEIQPSKKLSQTCSCSKQKLLVVFRCTIIYTDRSLINAGTVLFFSHSTRIAVWFVWKTIRIEHSSNVIITCVMCVYNRAPVLFFRNRYISSVAFSLLWKYSAGHICGVDLLFRNCSVDKPATLNNVTKWFGIGLFVLEDKIQLLLFLITFKNPCWLCLFKSIIASFENGVLFPYGDGAFIKTCWWLIATRRFLVSINFLSFTVLSRLYLKLILLLSFHHAHF